MTHRPLVYDSTAHRPLAVKPAGTELASWRYWSSRREVGLNDRVANDGEAVIGGLGCWAFLPDQNESSA
jgi:hypothetical protein